MLSFIGMTSCSLDYPPGEAGEQTVIYSNPEELVKSLLKEGSSIETQIESLRTGDGVQNFTENGLKFLDYRLRTGKCVKEEVIDEIFAPDAWIPRYTGECFNFTINTIAQRMKEDDEEGSFIKAVEAQKEFLRAFDWNNVAVYDLEWDYKGKKIYTVALALKSINAFLYDNILDNTIVPPGPPTIHITVGEDDDTSSRSAPNDIIDIQPAGFGKDTIVVYRNVECSFGWRDDRVLNNRGVLIMTYTILHNVHGDVHNLYHRDYEEPTRMVKFNGSYTYSNYKIWLVGWAGNVQCVRREINPVMHGYSIADWAWGIASGLMANVSISYVGFGFQITGASQYHQGTGEVREGDFLYCIDNHSHH